MSYQHKKFGHQMFILQTVLLGVLFYRADSSFVTLGSQGYENVLVQISDNVPSTNCKTTFVSLQIMLQDASKAICTATKTRAFFRNVTIMVPNHWPDECVSYFDSSVIWPRPHLSDIILNEDHPVFGTRPFSLQYGGCGINSLAIQLPISFLSSGSTRGVNVAHEWFHYRYGVFDETGVSEDDLYPVGYKISQPEASLLPTSCTNVPLQGEWVQNNWENSGDNGNVTSSIMYNTSLFSINLPCTKENHLKAPPTKQNWLCEGRSISEIVSNHEDFVTSNETKKCVDPLFNIVRNPHRGYHIILDKSATMTTALESAVFAISHFIWFLPDGSTISIDTFDSGYGQLQTPIVLNNITTKNIVIKVLNTVRPTNENTDGLDMALNNAIRLFRTGLDIILITGTETVSNGYDNLVDEFHRNLIAPHVIALNIRTTQVLADLFRDGWLYFIPKWADVPAVGKKSRNPQTWMVDTLQSIYSRSRKHRAKVEEKTIELNTGWNNGSFKLDSAGSNLMFAFYPLDNGAGLTIKDVLLYGPSGDEECYVIKQNSIILYASICKSNTAFEAGNWTYHIKVIDGNGMMRLDTWFEGFSEVRVLSWTSAIQNKPIDWTIDRLVIYAQVFQERMAVIDTNPIVHLIGDNSTEVVSVALSENDPSDITKNDGIYSAIIANLPRSSTRFYYIIEINDGDGMVEGNYTGQHPMAGSSIPVSMPTNLMTKFNRFVYGGSFQLNQPFDGIDVLPPARVIDLSINNAYNQSVIELKWTASTDNYGLSTTLAESFVVTWEDDLDLGYENVYFNGSLRPSSGSVDNMSLTVHVPAANQSRNVYYRVYALDIYGNKGQSSNIVTLYVPGVDSKTPDSNNDSTLPPALFWFLIGLGIVCLILIVAVISFCFYRKRKERKRQDMGADWVQIGETRLDLTMSSGKKNDSPVPEVPDFNMSTISRRRSSELFTSSRLSIDGYSDGSEIYQQPQVVLASAVVESSRKARDSDDYSDSELSFQRNTAPVKRLKFGDTWNPSPPINKVLTSSKKSPPKPPPRHYFPYSSDTNVNRNSSSTGNLHPLASSPSYLASQLKNGDSSYGEERMPKSYSQMTLTSASNSSLGRFGVVLLGADSEASLV